jgi:excisionase family DNA binding protein
MIIPIALNVPKAVAYSGLSRSRLFELIQSGCLPSFLVGGRRMILRDAVDAFIHRAARGGQ